MRMRTIQKRRVNGKLIYERRCRNCLVIFFGLNAVVWTSIVLGKLTYHSYLFLKETVISIYCDGVAKNESGSHPDQSKNRTSADDYSYLNFFCGYKDHFFQEIGITVAFNVFLLAFLYASHLLKISAVKKRSELVKEKVSFCYKIRIKYWYEKIRDFSEDAEAHIFKLISAEKSIHLAHLNHPNIRINPMPRREVYYDLKAFMFSRTWSEMPGHLPPYIDIVVYIRDIMRAVKYLHHRHLYHLDICPENILIVRCPDNPSGIVKVANFECLTYNDRGIVERKKVGLDWRYRPPEFYIEDNVPAASVDIWSIGATAYDVLTGGYLTIESERAYNCQKFHEFIQAEGFLELSNFTSAVEASWQYTDFLGLFSNIVHIGDTVYNLRPQGFLTDSFEFVVSLMQFNPYERATLGKALKSNFITKSIDPKFLCDFKIFRTHIYLAQKYA